MSAKSPSANVKPPLQQYFLTFPPYWEKLSATNFSGVHYRLAQRVYQHAGLDVEFVNVPYSRMQLQVAQGNVAFINYGEVKDVNTDDILHVCIPPTAITLRVYYLDNRLKEITKEKDFEGQKVIILYGLPLGNYEGIKSNENIQFMRPNSIKSAMQGLVTGRGDYFIVFDNTMINAQEHFFPANSYQLKNYPLYTLLGYPVTTPKTFPGGQQVCKKVKDSYHALVKEGVINKQYKILNSDLANFALKNSTENSENSKK